jgi:cytochrome c553
MKRLLAVVALLGAAAPLFAQAPADKLLKGCAECHGANGVATKPGVPHMDGQKNVYLADSLKGFADGKRPTAIVQHKQIPADEIVALANHYAALPIARPQGKADAALVARGEKLYLARCADCHFDSGRDADKDAPLLAAQDYDYLLAQTLAFRRGQRKFPFMMDDGYRGLEDDDLVAIVRFFNAQDPTLPPTPRKKRRKNG